jgi:ankyrin repeat protein
MIGVVLWISFLVEAVLAQSPARVDFARDVQPLLRQYCFACHGPAIQQKNLRLDRRRDAMNIGLRRVIFPGDSAASPLYLRISGTLGLQMPPTGALTPEEIGVIKAWIDQGAEWPDELSGEASASRPDPRAVRIMDMLRTGNRQAFRKAVLDDPAAVNLSGSGGSTPLMYAALYGDKASVQFLLERGAKPNAQNDAGATALMWAVDDAAKTKLLLDHGADPNVRSADGHTALTAAVIRPGSALVLKYLFDSGAKLPPGNATPALLTLAARTGDEAILRILIEHGADVRSSRLVLTYAVRTGCARCVDLVMDSAGQDDLNAALAEAAQAGDALLVNRLADHRANVNAVIDTNPQARSPSTVLVAAAFSEWIPTEAVKTLLEHDAQVNAKSPNGETALDFALRNGNTPVVDLLRKAGALQSGATNAARINPKPAPSVRAAIERSIPLLQMSDVTFLRKSGCVSCHSNSLTAMTIASARKQRITVDETVAREQLLKAAAYTESWRERILQGDAIPGLWNTLGYILTGLAAEKYPADAATEALARYLKNTQLQDGRWFNLDGHLRPPVDSSDIQTTAMAIRALQVYAPGPQQPEYRHAVQRAAVWLSNAHPITTEDRAFQLFGLAWAGGYQEALQRAARDLLAQQRSDGGWSQLPSLASDAYATGQVLVALKQSGAITTSGAAFKRGTRFLMDTQLEDGSWFVKSRSIPVMPYIESDFPHVHDQFISAAATNWATQALVFALQ